MSILTAKVLLKPPISPAEIKSIYLFYITTTLKAGQINNETVFAAIQGAKSIIFNMVIDKIKTVTEEEYRTKNTALDGYLLPDFYTEQYDSDPIFGAVNKKALVDFVNNMESVTKQRAENLMNLSHSESDTLTAGSPLCQVINALPVNSTTSSYLRNAFELLDNQPNSQACQMYYADGNWRCFPTPDEKEAILKTPENYAAISLSFAALP